MDLIHSMKGITRWARSMIHAIPGTQRIARPSMAGMKGLVTKHPAALVIIGLVLFHIINGIIVIKQDQSFLITDTIAIYHDSLLFLGGLPHRSVIGNILSFYKDTNEAYPPLLGRTAAVIFMLFGISQDNARMTNLLFFPVLLVSMYLLGKKLFNKRVGLIATVLLSFFPGIFSLSRSFRVDFPLTAFVTLTALLMLHADGFTSTKKSALFGLSLSLAALTKASFSLYLIGPFIVLAIAPLARRILNGQFAESAAIILNIGIAGLIATIMAGPWYVLHSAEYLFLNRLMINFPREINFHTDLKSLVLWPLAWLFWIGILNLLRKNRGRKAIILALLSWIVVPYLSYIAIRFADHFNLIRLLAPTLPAVALVIAVLIDDGRRFFSMAGASQNKNIWLAVIVALLLVEVPLCLAISYLGSGDLRFPLASPEESTHFEDPQEMPWQSDFNGITSPLILGFELEDISGALREEFSRKNGPMIFFLNFYNPRGLISLGLQWDILSWSAYEELGQDGSPPIVLSCLQEPLPFSELRKTDNCTEVLAYSDYAVIEPLRCRSPEKRGCMPLDPAIASELIKFSEHVRERLGEFTVMHQVTLAVPRTSGSLPYNETYYPGFEWLNGSTLILKKKN